MAKTPEEALARGFSSVRGAKAEVDAHDSAHRAKHEEEDAALDPHIMEEIAISVVPHLRREKSNADLRSPAQAHHGRNEQRDTSRPKDARCREGLHLPKF